MSTNRPPKKSEITVIAKACAAMWGQRDGRVKWKDRSPDDQWGWYFEADAILTRLYLAGYRIRKAHKGEPIPSIWEEAAITEEADSSAEERDQTRADQAIIVNVHGQPDADAVADIARALRTARQHFGPEWGE